MNRIIYSRRRLSTMFREKYETRICARSNEIYLKYIHQNLSMYFANEEYFYFFSDDLVSLALKYLRFYVFDFFSQIKTKNATLVLLAVRHSVGQLAKKLIKFFKLLRLFSLHLSSIAYHSIIIKVY